MKNKGITFGNVDSAYEILYLTEGGNIGSGENVALARSINAGLQGPAWRIHALNRPEPGRPVAEAATG